MIHAIALELKKLRISKGISQENLSFSSGLNRNYIGIIEKGETNISMAVFFNICKGLNENPATILEKFDLQYMEQNYSLEAKSPKS